MDPFTQIIRALIGKKAVDTASKAVNKEEVKNVINDVKAGAEMAGQNAVNAATDAVNWVGNTASKVKNKASQILDDASKKGKEAFNGALDSYFKLFGLGYKDGQVYSPEVEKVIQQLSDQAKKNNADTETLQEVVQAVEDKENNSAYDAIVKIAKDSGYTPSDAEVDTVLQGIKNREILNKEKPAEKTEAAAPAKEDEGEVITYTYKPGDTFGQVLLNLGLSDGSNLWGQGGDVEYYTQQLRDQNMLDYNGNVKLGIPFKLRRRK